MKLAKGFALTSVCSSLLVTTLVPFMATAQNAASSTMSPLVTTQAANQSAYQYWSNARMRAAKPADTIFPGAPKQPKQAVAQSQSPSGPPVSAPSGGPTARQTSIQRLGATQVNPGGAQPLHYSYPFPYTRYFVPYNNYTDYPHTTVGKLFFTKPTGGDFVCTAAAVNSTNKRLIVTAGHCLSDGNGNWFKNVLFVPAYNPNNSDPNKREPYGRWSGCQLYARNAWHLNSDWGKDIGMIKACDRGGSRLHDVVGYLGYRANVSREQTWHAFGYPQAAPFDGTKMTVCVAPHGTDDSSVSPSRIGIGCDMTPGLSGGPWILNYTPNYAGEANYINGVNSWEYYAQPKAWYSPYFGNDFLNLRNYAISNGA